MEKKWDRNYTYCFQQILEATSQEEQLDGYLIPITQTIQVRRTKHAGHCWRSEDELITDVLLQTPSHELL